MKRHPTDFVLSLELQLGKWDECLLTEQGSEFVRCTEALIIDRETQQRHGACNRNLFGFKNSCYHSPEDTPVLT